MGNMALAEHSQQIRTIARREVTVDPSSFVDPQGFVFSWNERLYRCIRSQAAPLFRRLLDDGTLAALEQDHGLVNTAVAPLVVDDEPDGLVVEHPRVHPLSYCVEWCPSMLRDAGRTTLELTIELAGRDMMLQDAYPWNVLFSGNAPVFVDLTSIVPADRATIWPAHEQFEAFFLRPLALAAEGKGKVARALLHDNIDGIGLEDFSTLMSASYHLRHPGLTIACWVDRQLQRRGALKMKVRQLAERASTNIDPAVRRRFLQGLRRRLDGFTFADKANPWTHYYSEISSEFDKQAKLNAITGLLESIQPRTVLDLGCNTGVFSLLAARQGARVIAIDSSESCIEALYAAARQDSLPVTPLIADVVNPTPAFGFMGRQYPGLWQRTRADTVLCLALMHHLHITGRQSFERIAELLDEVTGQHLIFEFVAHDDANVPLLPKRRRIDYTLNSVVAALERAFKDIDVRPSDRETRKLLVCRK